MAAISSTPYVITPSMLEEIQQKFSEFLPLMQNLQQKSTFCLTDETVTLIKDIVSICFSQLKNATDTALKCEKLKHNKEINERTAALEQEKALLKNQIKQLIETSRQDLNTIAILRQQLNEKNIYFAELDKVNQAIQERLKGTSTKGQKTGEAVQAMIVETGTFEKLGKDLDAFIKNLESVSIIAIGYAEKTIKVINNRMRIIAAISLIYVIYNIGGFGDPIKINFMRSAK